MDIKAELLRFADGVRHIRRCVEQGALSEEEAGEMCDKLAMIYTLSGDCTAIEISLDAALWAHQFVHRHAERLLWRASNMVAETDFERLCKRMMEILRSGEGGRRTRGDVLKRFHNPAKVLDPVANHLLETNQIRTSNIKRAVIYEVVK